MRGKKVGGRRGGIWGTVRSLLPLTMREDHGCQSQELTASCNTANHQAESHSKRAQMTCIAMCSRHDEAKRAYVVAVKQPLAGNCLLLLYDTGAGLPRRMSQILLSSRQWRQRTLSKSNTFRPLSSLHVANLASVGEKEMSLTARVCTAQAPSERQRIWVATHSTPLPFMISS